MDPPLQVHLVHRFHDTDLIDFLFFLSNLRTFSDRTRNRPGMSLSNSSSDKAANEPAGKSHVVWETFIPSLRTQKEFGSVSPLTRPINLSKNNLSSKNR